MRNAHSPRMRCTLTMNSNNEAVSAPPRTVVLDIAMRRDAPVAIGRALMEYAREHNIDILDVGYAQKWEDIANV